MKDRIPGAPGQYKAVVTEAELLNMQSGKEFTITLVRDDQPIEGGTPYSKAAVLPDELAEQLCPGLEDPTPADALRALHSNHVSVRRIDSKELSRYAYIRCDIEPKAGCLAAMIVVTYKTSGTGGEFVKSLTYLLSGLSYFSHTLIELASHLTNATSDIPDDLYAFRITVENERNDGTASVVLKNMADKTATMSVSVVPICGNITHLV